MVCKFDVNLHFVSVSLMQVCIKLTLHKCKFDANLHQTYTQFCENCLCFSFSYYFLLFLIVLLVVLFIFCIFLERTNLCFLFGLIICYSFLFVFQNLVFCHACKVQLIEECIQYIVLYEHAVVSHENDMAWGSGI